MGHEPEISGVKNGHTVIGHAWMNGVNVNATELLKNKAEDVWPGMTVHKVRSVIFKTWFRALTAYLDEHLWE